MVSSGTLLCIYNNNEIDEGVPISLFPVISSVRHHQHTASPGRITTFPVCLLRNTRPPSINMPLGSTAYSRHFKSMAKDEAIWG